MPTMILREIREKKDWNLFEVFPSAPFTQSFEYGLWQENVGRKVFRFVILENNSPVCFLSFIQYKLFLGKYYWYCPYGPVSKENNNELLLFIKQKIESIAKEYNVSFVRFDFSEVSDEGFLGNNFFRVSNDLASGSYIQPRFEWVLDLDKSLEEIRVSMSSNAKLSMNKALKEGVEVFVTPGSDTSSGSNLIRLMEETSKRNNFSLHQREYYEGVFKTLDQNNSFFCQAKLRGEVLASVLIIINGSEAFFLFGGSSNSASSDISASYITHFKAIEECKKRNLGVYNFGGISGLDGNPKSLRGVTSFKKKFGGRIREHKNLSDIVINKLVYKLYNLRKSLKK